MATLLKEVNYNLASLIQQIDLGLIGLPDIQRPFVWKDTKVWDLLKACTKDILWGISCSGPMPIQKAKAIFFLNPLKTKN